MSSGEEGALAHLLRLSGLWLKGAGFLIAQRYEIHVSRGRLAPQTV